MDIGAGQQAVDKVETAIPGFDLVAFGGLPRERSTLVSGTAGSGKTVFCAQFLAEGILHAGEAGVFVTFEESPEDIRRNLAGFGWDVARWESEDLWAFVDASPSTGADTIETGPYDLGALLARVEHAIRRTGATRVSIDSVASSFHQFESAATVRTELCRLGGALKKMGVTSVVTAERTEEYGDIARHGVEEFVADNVIILRNGLEGEKRRRTLEILKFRGTDHQKGEFPFSVTPDRGVVLIPISAIQLNQRSSDVRVSSGNSAMDDMCGGGFFRDSVILVSGATGTGKTLMVTEFTAAGARSEERCLILAYEESREQLLRNARGWGVDFEGMEREGTLRISCMYPEVMGLEDHLIRMKRITEEFEPTRVAVDSLSALERVSTAKGFREFVIGLTSFIKHRETVGLFTATTPTLLGGTSVTEAQISTITDSIILLRYVEMFGEMHRGVTVLKMRGSIHDKEIREFHIDGEGMHIGKPFRNASGILAGNPVLLPQEELDRLEELFDAPEGRGY